MDKIWLNHYPAGVIKELHSVDYNSLAEFIAAQCEKFSDKLAFENFGVGITYRQFNELSHRFAAYLQSELKLEKGDHFAIMLPNILQFPLVLYAALLSGLVVVNVNPLYTKRELIHQLSDAGVNAIIVLENFAHVVAEALPRTKVKHVIVTKMGDCLPGLKGQFINFYLKIIRRQIPKWTIAGARFFSEIMREAQQQQMSFVPVSCQAEEIAMLQYTGGTTGIAKGAMLTHQNLLANIFQCLSWVRSTLTEGKDTIITALPLYHIFSLTGCFFFMVVGAKALLITNPRDTKHFITILRKTHFTVMVGVNTLFNTLMHHAHFSKINFSSLRLVISGGMALQKPVADRWQELTRSVIVEGYGLTEASPVISINPVTIPHFTGSVGMPIPSTEVSIRDSNDGHELSVGKIGELWVRGPQVMVGYWQQPQATREVLDAEGWLRTGDIARIDEDGMIYIVDRAKDMIIVSGFNVYPNEIEEVIMSHPLVKEVAVVGVPNGTAGEAVKAFVVRQTNELDVQAILNFCQERLTKYKIPKFIEFREQLPKSNVGKVLRRELR